MDPILDLIKSIGKKERAISKEVFISPIFNTDQVVTSVNGLIQKLSIPETKPGWYKIKPINLVKAKILGDADFMEIDGYLKKLDKIRMLIVYKDKDIFFGIPLKNNNVGLDFSQPIPILLASEDQAQFFDLVSCRYDGANVWYHEPDMTNDPAKSEYLRDQFEKYFDPKKIQYKGLTLEEKLAYALRYNLDKKFRETLKENMLKKDVEHAGGQFVKFLERKDHFSVTYLVDGQSYTSYVSKDPAHHVITAGICLSGGDRAFDLASLVNVLREGQHKGRIHRYNNTR